MPPATLPALPLSMVAPPIAPAPMPVTGADFGTAFAQTLSATQPQDPNPPPQRPMPEETPQVLAAPVIASIMEAIAPARCISPAGAFQNAELPEELTADSTASTTNAEPPSPVEAIPVQPPGLAVQPIAIPVPVVTEVPVQMGEAPSEPEPRQTAEAATPVSIAATPPPIPSAPPPKADAGQPSSDRPSLIGLRPQLSPITVDPAPKRPQGPENTSSVSTAQPAAASTSFILPLSPIAFQPVDLPRAVDAASPVIDISAKEWTASLSREIIAANDRGEGALSLRLSPQYLGNLDIGLAETPQGLIVELRPSSEEAQQVIAREEPRLLEELRQRGVAVADYSLRFGSGDDGRRHHNGATAQPFLPLKDTDRGAVQDQDQDEAPSRGRFA